MRLFRRTTVDLSPKIELGDQAMPEASKTNTVTIENENPSEIAIDDDLVTTIELREHSVCSLFTIQLSKVAQCKTFKRVLLLIVILNIVQIIIFFIVTTTFLPLRTKRLLDSGDTGFIIRHIPDEYVDYNYFNSMVGS